MHIAEACRRALGEHVRVMLSFKGGNRLSGMTDHKGEAIIAIDESLWVAGGGMLRGTAYVEGEPVRAFVLTNASPGSE